MSRTIKTLVANVEVPGSGNIETAQTILTISDENFQRIPAAAFTASKLQDLGSTTGAVSVVAPFVAAPAALTSAQNATANGSDPATTQALANALKVSYNALQVDVAAVRTTLAATLVALKTAGGPMAAS